MPYDVSQVQIPDPGTVDDRTPTAPAPYHPAELEIIAAYQEATAYHKAAAENVLDDDETRAWADSARVALGDLPGDLNLSAYRWFRSPDSDIEWTMCYPPDPSMPVQVHLYGLNPDRVEVWVEEDRFAREGS